MTSKLSFITNYSRDNLYKITGNNALWERYGIFSNIKHQLNHIDVRRLVDELYFLWKYYAHVHHVVVLESMSFT